MFCIIPLLLLLSNTNGLQPVKSLGGAFTNRNTREHKFQLFYEAYQNGTSSKGKELSLPVAQIIPLLIKNDIILALHVFTSMYFFCMFFTVSLLPKNFRYQLRSQTLLLKIFSSLVEISGLLSLENLTIDYSKLGRVAQDFIELSQSKLCQNLVLSVLLLISGCGSGSLIPFFINDIPFLVSLLAIYLPPAILPRKYVQSLLDFSEDVSVSESAYRNDTLSDTAAAPSETPVNKKYFEYPWLHMSFSALQLAVQTVLSIDAIKKSFSIFLSGSSSTSTTTSTFSLILSILYSAFIPWSFTRLLIVRIKHFLESRAFSQCVQAVQELDIVISFLSHRVVTRATSTWSKILEAKGDIGGVAQVIRSVLFPVRRPSEEGEGDEGEDQEEEKEDGEGGEDVSSGHDADTSGEDEEEVNK